MELKEIPYEGADRIQLHVDWIVVTTVVKVMVTYQWGQFHDQLQDSGFEEGQFCPHLTRDSTVLAQCSVYTVSNFYSTKH
jgi:hypothetical protein